MKKALITGSNGFVGPYLRQELEAAGYAVTGIDLKGGEGTVAADLLDGARLLDIVSCERPDAIFHLAGQSNVAQSWKTPQETIKINVIGAINLMEAVRAAAPKCRVLLVGTSDIYGNLGDAGQSADESIAARHITPYGVSKKAQEEMAGAYARAYGLDICVTRSFNHSGAGQRTGFIIPDFCFQIARLEKEGGGAIRVGNLQMRRDFSHVKDVAAAYRVIMEKGTSGEIYPVGSGRTYCGEEILDMLKSMATVHFAVEQPKELARGVDRSVPACDNHKLKELGWQPKYTMEDILRDCLNYYRERR